MFRNVICSMLGLIVTAAVTVLPLESKTVICYSAGGSEHYTIYPKNINCDEFKANAACKCVTDCWHTSIRTGDVKVFVSLVGDKLKTLRNDEQLAGSIRTVDSLVARLAHAEENLAGAVLLDGPFKYIAAAELHVGRAYSELTDLFDRITEEAGSKDSLTTDVAGPLNSVRTRLTLAIDELERIRIDSAHTVEVIASSSGDQYVEVGKGSEERLLINILPSSRVTGTGSVSLWNVTAIAALILALVAVLGMGFRARRRRTGAAANPVS